MFRFVPFSFSDKNIRIKQRRGKVEEIKIESSKKLRYNKREQKGTTKRGFNMTLVATQVKRRRGTNDENDAFAGAEGEITVDLTNKELRVHDGSGKKGGFRVGHYSYTSNGITEIPQNIKLELNNGTLTLKAGSKIYIPNGAGVFNEITTTADINLSGASTNPNAVRILTYNNGTLHVWGNHQSGTTPPSTGTNAIFYNTSDNTIKRYTNGVVQASGYSFPLALIKDDGTYLCGSIEQVFNGFGYIGSNVFVLPALSVLTPNGRNADGTLNNKKYTFTACATYTRNISGSNIPLWARYNGTIGLSTGITYNPITNISDGAVGYAQIGMVDLTSGVISNFRPKTVFHAVDYNDTEFIGHQAMPSNKYIDLTLPASGGSLSMPADGYLNIVKYSNANQFIQIFASPITINSYAPNYDGAVVIINCPVRKGQVVVINYDLSGATTACRFVYAQGA